MSRSRRVAPEVVEDAVDEKGEGDSDGFLDGARAAAWHRRQFNVHRQVAHACECMMY